MLVFHKKTKKRKVDITVLIHHINNISCLNKLTSQMYACFLLNCATSYDHKRADSPCQSTDVTLKWRTT